MKICGFTIIMPWWRKRTKLSSNATGSIDEKKRRSKKKTSASTDTSYTHNDPLGPTPIDVAAAAEFPSFLAAYPSYSSSFLDDLRRTDFARLDNPQDPSVYLDYTGGGLYASSQVQAYANALVTNVYGNPHSTNPSSKLSSKYTHDAMVALLEFVDADPEIYTVVWTSNATGALKIVAEGFPYQTGQRLVAPTDCHNSVNGMRAFAKAAGAEVEYVNLPDCGKGLQPTVLEAQLKRLSATKPSPGLFVCTAQSNITGFKAPIHTLIPLASGMGYTTLLDGAALLPTSELSLRSLGNTLDALALSVYKMIGFPTGVGALIVKKKLLETLRKPWFCGGTVQLVQAPGEAVTMEPGPARFEDGTQNYISMIPIPRGLALLKEALPHLGERLPALLHWTVGRMAGIRHAGGQGKPLVLVRSPRVGMGRKEMAKLHGALIAFEVLNKEGEFVNCEVIEYAASKRRISLRAGCMCNPGGAASIMGMQEMMGQLQSGETKRDIQAKFGVRAAGVTRTSFGLASNFKDAFTFIAFLESLAEDGALARAIHAFYSKDRVVSAC